MGVISHFHFQVLLVLCVQVTWTSLAYASDTSRIQISDRILSDRGFGSQKIIFPEPVASDKYDFLFGPILPYRPPPKIYYRKEYKLKPHLTKSKPNFRYHYRKSQGPQPIPFYSPYVNRDFLREVTQELLKQTDLSIGDIGNSYNDGLHDPGIKPVTEHIKGDIKYDFRTKTHYYDR